jgi:galactokinase/galacturonokinase
VKAETAREDRIEALRRQVQAQYAVAARDVQVACAPYRICPLGAHSDHQHGPVLGAAIDACTLLAFAATERPALVLRSADERGEVEVPLAAAPRADLPAWGRYAQGAAAVLRARLGAAPRGLVGCLDGTLPGAGLSSSASLLVACLLALARANGLTLAPRELAALAQRAENEHVGVACGALDPSTVVGARRHHLLAIDTASLCWEAIAPAAGAPPARFLVAYSGVSRHLASTGFNLGVEECLRRAAPRRAAGLPAERPATFRRRLRGARRRAAARAAPARAPLLASARGSRRASRPGARAISAVSGDLMDAPAGARSRTTRRARRSSCASRRSCARRRACSARASGAGFGGSAVALVEADAAEPARAAVEAAFRDAFPSLARARAASWRSRRTARGSSRRGRGLEHEEVLAVDQVVVGDQPVARGRELVDDRLLRRRGRTTSRTRSSP